MFLDPPSVAIERFEKSQYKNNPGTKFLCLCVCVPVCLFVRPSKENLFTLGHSKHSKLVISRLLQGCLLGVPRVQGVSRLLQGLSKSVQWVFQDWFKNVLRAFLNLEEFTWMTKGCFKHVLRKSLDLSRASQGSF